MNLLNKLTATAPPQKLNLPELPPVEECELPIIDMGQLELGESAVRSCKKHITKASSEWGIF
ncbi:hypothetical protein ABFS82_14G248700 [Erythranthe guttata]